MTGKEVIFKIIIENFEHILTVVMGVFSMVAISKQSKKQQKHESAQKYIDLKFNVFQSFVDALVRYEGNPTVDNFDTLVSAQNKVIILVHPAYTEAFDNLCIVLTEIAEAQQAKKSLPLELETEFKTALKIVRGILRDEMQEFDPGKHKLAKRFLRKQRMKKLLEKTSCACKEKQQTNANT